MTVGAFQILPRSESVPLMVIGLAVFVHVMVTVEVFDIASVAVIVNV